MRVSKFTIFNNFYNFTVLSQMVVTNTMMVELGEKLYFAAGSDKILKSLRRTILSCLRRIKKMEKDKWLK